MNYLSAAKVLDELMLELIEKGMAIPTHVTEDLKAARALASMAARQPGCDEALEVKIASALERVEMNLLALAEAQAGHAGADSWQHRIAGAYQEPPQAPPAPKRVQGAPRGSYWVRIQTSQLEGVALPEGDFTAVAQDDGYTLAYGKQETVTQFLNDIRQKLGKVGFKRNS